MSFIDKIKGIINIPEEEYYDEMEREDYMTYNPAEEEVAYERPQPRYSQRRRAIDEEDPNKVVDIHTTAKLQVVLAKPERFEDARDIADNLNEKRTVVLNLESTNREIARRLVDFLSGVAYANQGELKKVANNTFIITPYNVDVMGDLIDELENTGVFF
ncbi:MAG TPA: cell division protein SepF [Oscillospiraceae bacterium]|nr:cell division protein SepF [Oscillospiraceae bacterium]